MKQDQPFFSIIVPTYNRPRQLAECLRALAALDYPRRRFEVIVVDDGSDSPLAEVIAPFHPLLRLALVTQENAGPGAARNTGAALAEGTFLAFTDDDCLPTGQWLTALAARFAEYPHRAIAGRTINALPHNPFARASQIIIDLVHAYYNADPQQARFSASNNLALPRELFRSLGGFDETFRTSEDRDLIDRWLNRGHRLIYAPEVLVYHAPLLTWRGYCRLNIQVTHLKRWTFVSLLCTDIFRRAVPWSRLILRQGDWVWDLNVDARSRLSAVWAWAALFFLVLGFWLPSVWWGLLPALTALAVINADLYRFFWRHGGPGFTVGAAALHALYLIYSSLTFAVLAGQAWLGKTVGGLVRKK